MPLYVSAVEGHLVPRYGTARQTPGRTVEHVLSGPGQKKRSVPLREPGRIHGHEVLGVTRTPVLETRDEAGRLVEAAHWNITWDTEHVFAISDHELVHHRPEYEQHIRDGALVRRTAADHKAWLEKHREGDAKVAEEARKARAKELAEAHRQAAADHAEQAKAAPSGTAAAPAAPPLDEEEAAPAPHAAG